MSLFDDYRHMARALELAARGLHTTDPNPRVGCVIVRQGEIVGEGWHEVAGEPHAEVHALQQAGERSRGADVYVTLEPCSHHGRTPPCSQALIDAGVARVIVAMQDLNPRVSGSGMARLRAAGIAVDCGIMQAEARALNPGFIMRMEQGRPHVRCKMAMSLDGRTAMASGESRWISGEAARHDVQELRARSSAIMTGINTVLMDDPSLTVREVPRTGVYSAAATSLRQPLRVVLDAGLRMPFKARLLSAPGRTLILTGVADQQAHSTLSKAGAEVVTLPLSSPGLLNLGAVLECLAQREVNELLLESGPVLSGALLQAGLIDELVIYVAPMLMGDGARGLFHLPGLETLAQKIPLHIIDQRQVGQDWRITAQVYREE
ncbi:MAG: riboflavin biosynthesis protein RibD [Gammaproteobacteria bacterium RBG_16_57_12]|nr:MAG: riboflavin biosynthesis protein RibD [Gammaproteobacteria bacterium RBG_16_57_12]